MKPLCIVDTCSLIYWNGVQLGRQPLQKWLCSEFEARYSSVVSDEIKRHQNEIQRCYKRCQNVPNRCHCKVWEYSTIATCEKALFTSSFFRRKVVAGVCKQCNKEIWREQQFKIDLDHHESRGERYNCCIALDAVTTGKYSQVIFMTDDLRAVRDFVGQVFRTFPLGQVWSSLDFVTYLFIRHRNRITPQDAKVALKDINTQGTGNEDPERKIRRLKIYNDKIDQISYALSQIQGGH